MVLKFSSKNVSIEWIMILSLQKEAIFNGKNVYCIVLLSLFLLGLEVWFKYSKRLAVWY